LDEFWTAAEMDFRARAAELFRNLPDPSTPEPARLPEEIWRELDALALEETDPIPVSAAHLSGRVSIFDEASRHDPRLGHELLAWFERSHNLDPAGWTACELGRLAGTASHVFAAGTAAARERGYFSSILMDFRMVQERLAGLHAGSELARLGACRLCRLLVKGDTIAAGRETSGLAAWARTLEADVRSVSGSLLGPEWTQNRLAASNSPFPEERTGR